MRILIALLIFTSSLVFSSELIVFKNQNKSYIINDFEINNSNYYFTGDNNRSNNESYWKGFYMKFSNENIQKYIQFSDFGRGFYSNIEIDENENKYILNLAANTNRQDDIIVRKLNKKDSIVESFIFGEYHSDDELLFLKYHLNYIYAIGATGNAAIIIKLDTNLKKIWAKEFTYNNVYFLESYYFEEDKITCIGWDRYDRDYNNYTLAQSIDLNGNILNQQIINFEKQNYQVRNSPDMVKIENGYLYYLRRYEDEDIQPYLVRIDDKLETQQIFDVQMLNSETIPIMAEDNNYFYLVNSNNQKSFIHSFSKLDLKYQKSFYIKEFDNYKINLIKSDKDNFQVSGYTNSNFFILNTKINDKCYFQDTTLNIEFVKVNSFSKIEDTPTVIDVNNEFTEGYTISNDHNIIAEFSSCSSSPCGDGSSFETKINSIDKFTLYDVEERNNSRFLMTDTNEIFSYGLLSYQEPVFITAGFETEFAFSVSDGYNDFEDGSLAGADGFSLIFSESQNLNIWDEQLGGGMGYSGRKNGLAMEIDLYKNTEFNDPNGNHLAVQQKSNKYLVASHSNDNTLAIDTNMIEIQSDSSKVYYCKMKYDNSSLKIWVDRTQNYNSPNIELKNFNFNKYLTLTNNSQCYVSLVATTGSSNQRQEVLYWNWCSSFDPISSVEENESKSEYTIYPNPSSDIIKIEGIKNNTEVEIYDITGRLIMTATYKDELDISNLTRGLYSIKVNSQYCKFIKE